MDKPTVLGHFVRAALWGAKRKGLDPARLLIEAGIPVSLLHQPKARITTRQYANLIQALWNSLEDEFMGFTEYRSKPGTFATMCHLVIHCHTLSRVLKRSQAFYNLFEKPVSLAIQQDGDIAKLVLHGEGLVDDPHHFMKESLLVMWHRFACWLIGQHIKIELATFDYPAPEHVSQYKHLFFGPTEFEADECALHFHARYLAMPIIQDEAALRDFLQTSPADLLAKPDDHNSYTAKIRTIIGRDFSQEFPDFETIAGQLNISPQTLRRRLKEEGASYQEIKDNMRRDAAIYHLSRNEVSINDIALMVGFTEPSTFHRAFKKWTGVTPGAYREEKIHAAH